MVQTARFDDEVDLRQYLLVLKKRWKLAAVLTLCFAAFMVFFTYQQEPVYEAKATFLVRSSGGGVVSQFASIGGVVGVNMPGKDSGITGDISAVIKSRALAKKILSDLDLRSRIKNWDDPKISDDKLAAAISVMLIGPKFNGNLVELKVECTDPKLVADITNCYVDALAYYLNMINLTEARKKREYIEKQLPVVDRELREAETRLKSFSLIGVGRTSIEMNRLEREVEIKSSVYNLLRKEYESVKLEESKEIPPFMMVDAALIPEKPVRPNVGQSAIVGMFLGAFFGVSLSFLINYLEKF